MSEDSPPRLARRLGLPILVLYGLGTTVGAGIYALTGEVAGLAGLQAPLAFVAAAALAGLTALSLAELSARYPRAAGEAVYVREGLGAPRLATAVGLAVGLAGCVSAATVARGFVGYAGTLLVLPGPVVVLGLVGGLSAVAIWGIGQSARLAAAMTVIEVAGLVLVAVVAGDALGDLPDRAPELWPGTDPGQWSGILAGIGIAFYAFLGFEDMVNVAEEVIDVRRTLPLAIVATLVLTLVLYAVLVLVAVLAVPPRELAASEAPLARVYEQATGGPPWLLGAIGVIAMTNGALIQMVKASRVLYGLADQGALPGALARVHPRRHTPVAASLLVAVVVIALALALPLAALARATAWITLAVFCLVNAALLRVHRRGPAPEDVPRVPGAVPALGLVVSLAFLVSEAVSGLASEPWRTP